MKKIIGTMLISTIIIGGCSKLGTQNTENQHIPDKIAGEEYVGQGFQPKAEKSVIAYAKKHRKAFEKLGEDFFKENFGLNVKVMNVVGSGAGVEVYVKCDDRGIKFHTSMVFSKDSIEDDISLRTEDTSSEMQKVVSAVMSGFEYKANKAYYDKLEQFFEENKNKYNYVGYRQEAIDKTQDHGYQNPYFYIQESLHTIQEYRQYYKPLIDKKGEEIKAGIKSAKKGMDYGGNPKILTTMISKDKDFDGKKHVEDVLKISDSIKEQNLGSREKELYLRMMPNDVETNDASLNTNQGDFIKYLVKYPGDEDDE